VYTGILAYGPEFETLYSFGGQTGVTDVDSIIAADRLCDELGLDALSTGVTIGFAMELFEKGIFKLADTDGLELNFGNEKSMHVLIRNIAYREGLGNLLAEGVKAAAEKIGQGSEKCAMHVKGLELPGYDVRGAKAHGLNYATSYTGADHCRGYAGQEIFGAKIPKAYDRFGTTGKGELTKWNQDIRLATCDCPTMCEFILPQALASVGMQNTAALMEALTGLTFPPEELWQLGERITNLARAFNVREGFGRKDDTLPDRLMLEPLKGGASRNQVISPDDLNKMLDEYYTVRGWNIRTGVPTRLKLASLVMINVSLYTITEFKEIIGQNRTDFVLPDGSRLKEFVTKLSTTWGDKLSSKLIDSRNNEIFPYIRVAVNGQDIAFLNGLETELHDGDEVLIVPPVAGG
jgi:aldehyde:ferredoxin oxidoreductase